MCFQFQPCQTSYRTHCTRGANKERASFQSFIRSAIHMQYYFAGKQETQSFEWKRARARARVFMLHMTRPRHTHSLGRIASVNCVDCKRGTAMPIIIHSTLAHQSFWPAKVFNGYYFDAIRSVEFPLHINAEKRRKAPLKSSSKRKKNRILEIGGQSSKCANGMHRRFTWAIRHEMAKPKQLHGMITPETRQTILHTVDSCLSKQWEKRKVCYLFD